MRNKLDREHGESGDTYDRVVVRLIAKWRVVECRAGILWLLLRRKSACDGGGWSARSFCRTSEALRRVAAEHAGAIDPEAQEALDRLPEWIEDVDQPVRHELVDELDHPRDGPTSPTGPQASLFLHCVGRRATLVPSLTLSLGCTTTWVPAESPCACRKSNPDINVKQSAEDRGRGNAASDPNCP